MANGKVQLITKGGSSLAPITKLNSLVFTVAANCGLVYSSATNRLRTYRVPQANIYDSSTGKTLDKLWSNYQDTLKPGFGMVVNGATVGQLRYFDLQPDVTAGTVVLSAGCGYHIYANGAVVTLTEETYEAQHPNQFGLEGHAMIYLTNSAYLKTDGNVIIGSPLTYNAYNNCTLRFHDGHCIIDVEDTTTPD